MKRLTFCLLFATASFTAGAQAITDLKTAATSPVRTAILDAIRTCAAKDLKSPVKFVVNNLTVCGNYAFMTGRPTKPDGSPFDYHGTSYQQYIEQGMFDNNINALCRKTAGGWQCVEFAIGCTDVCYEPWPAQYKLPRRMFGFQ